MTQCIYAMAGTIGSGKTTLAKKIASEKRAVLFCIDECVNQLGQPIKSKEDYSRYYFGVRSIIESHAYKVLELGISVVFDFGGTKGHWEWLRPIAQKTDSEIEIFHLIAPIEIRRERIKKRNTDPNYFFQFSDKEFDSMPIESVTPEEQHGLKVHVTNTAL